MSEQNTSKIIDFAKSAETRAKAKELYLQRQTKQVLSHLELAEPGERAATTRQIDGFLNQTTPDGKIFWLKIREKLERLNERLQP